MKTDVKAKCMSVEITQDRNVVVELMFDNIIWYQYLIVNPYVLSTTVAWADPEGAHDSDEVVLPWTLSSGHVLGIQS